MPKRASRQVKKKPNSITPKSLVVKSLPTGSGGSAITLDPKQKTLFVTTEREIDGVGMGVLSDGTAFLNGRGLARLCGVANPRIVELGKKWSVTSRNAMVEGVKRILRDKRPLPEKPYVEVLHGGTIVYAYPDAICLAVLEYYAFEQPTNEAKGVFRQLAGKTLHDMIYRQVGYDPSSSVPIQWRQFHDRVSLTYSRVPTGYFCVFKEIADMIVHLGQMGLLIDESFVPDISVGKLWGTHWKNSGLASQHGDRVKFEHYYPDYFPQSLSNPQKPWCYPEMALGEFKRWVREDYIGKGKFEKYLSGQVAKKALPPSFAQQAIASYEQDVNAGAITVDS